MKKPPIPFPGDALLLVDPVTKNVLDFQPVMELLHLDYGGDKETLVEELNAVGDYLLREPEEEDRAATLRRMVRVVRRLAAALDTMTIQRMRAY